MMSLIGLKKIKLNGNKIMDCVFCHQQEKDARPHDKEVNSFVCSNCIQKFLLMSQVQIKKAYNLAIEKGYPEKAFWLEKFIDEEEYYGEAKEAGRDLGRRRPLRKAQTSRHQIRT